MSEDDPDPFVSREAIQLRQVPERVIGCSADTRMPVQESEAGAIVRDGLIGREVGVKNVPFHPFL